MTGDQGSGNGTSSVTAFVVSDWAGLVSFETHLESQMFDSLNNPTIDHSDSLICQRVVLWPTACIYESHVELCHQNFFFLMFLLASVWHVSHISPWIQLCFNVPVCCHVMSVFSVPETRP